MSDLTVEQKTALDDLLPFAVGPAGGVAVLEGFAGVGKTYLVARLLRELVGRGLKIAVAAPTNKAVRVARDMLERAGVVVAEAGEPAFGRWRRGAPEGVTCRTLHALLGLKLRERADGRYEAVDGGMDATLGEYDLVVVDEASMVGADLYRGVDEERGEDVRVLYVGDPAQLAPVAASSASPADSPVFRGNATVRARLSKIVRQAEGNPIIRMSVAIRRALAEGRRVTAGELADAAGDVGPVSVVSGGADAALVSLLDAREWDAGMDCRIVAYTNERVVQHNRRAHAALYGEGGAPFAVGERAMMQSQHETRMTGLFGAEVRLLNSEEIELQGCVAEVHRRFGDIPAWRLAVSRENGEQASLLVADDRRALDRRIDGLFREGRTDEGWSLRNAFADVRHCYSITAHKAQGSTFDAAIIDYNDLRLMRDTNEFNRCLYVAVTRSREYLVVVV